MKLTFKIFGVALLGLMILTTSCKKEENITSVKDAQGNTYKVVRIDKMFWMAQNLKNSKGMTVLNYTQLPSGWSTSTACCSYYAGNSSNAAYNAMGLSYNSVAMKKNPCPEGWHVPTSSEWKEMINYLGGANVAGGKLKDKDNNTYWQNNIGASNETGFTAQGSGCMNNGIAFGYRTYALYWSSDMQVYVIENSSTKIESGAGNIQNGCSIRCVKAVEKK